MSTVTSLGFSIFSRYDGSGVRRANRDINQLQRNTERSTSGLNNFTGRMSVMLTTAASLGPSLLPIGIVLAGVAAGTAGLAITGGAALGVYGAALKGAVTRTMELEAAGKRISPVQEQFARSTRVVSRAWTGFLDATANQTLDVANDGLVAMNNSIKRMPGIVKAVHPVMKQISTDIKNWTENGGLDRFVNIIKKFGVPALDALRRAGKDTLAALGIGFRTFLPLIKPITNAIESGAKSFRKWAEGGGFQRFLEKVQKNGPSVGEFFKNLGKALANISQAMGMLGPLSMFTASGLLRIAAAMPPSLLAAIVAGFIAWKIAMVGMMIAAALPKILYGIRMAWYALNLAFAASPIGFIITMVVLLIGVIVLIALKTRWFQNLWGVIWRNVKAVGLAIWGALKTAFNATWSFLKRVFGIVMGGISRAWRTVWNGIRTFGVAIWNGIRNVAGAIWRGMSAVVRGIWNGIRNAFRNVWNGIRSFATNTWNAIRNTASRTFHAVANTLRGIWNGIRNVFRNIWNGIRSFATNTWNGIKNTASRIFHGVANTLKGIWNGIVKVAKEAWNKVRSVVRTPIAFVINHVIAPLAKTFNSIAKAVHIGIRVPVPKFAAGGHVRGPGSGTSDQVPAMLSNGEYVIPAHVVRRKGVGFFDALRGGKDPQKTAPGGGFNGGGGAGGIPGMLLGGIIPNPIDVIKKVGKAAINATGIGKLLDTFGSWTSKFISGTLMKGVNAATGKIPGGGLVRDVVKSGAKSLIKGAVDLLFKQNNEAGGPIGGKIPKGARLALLRKALGLTHTPPPGTLSAWLKGLNTLITRESGWNAGARNGTDSNAKAGHASVGLMQTIPSTFAAFSLPGHKNIRNGLDNVIAGIRYIKNRYGNITKVQQANANMPPKGYKLGGMVNSFDRGGLLPTGLSLAYNGTGRPEPVGHNLGGGVTVEFNNCQFGGNMSKRDIENAVVTGLTEAERKGRIPRRRG